MIPGRRLSYFVLSLYVVMLLNDAARTCTPPPPPPPPPIPSSYYLDFDAGLEEWEESDVAVRVKAYDQDDPDTVKDLHMALDYGEMDDGDLTLSLETSGTGDITLMDADDNEISLPVTWDLSVEGPPEFIFIKGTATSSSERDTTIVVEYEEHDEETWALTDTISLTVDKTPPITTLGPIPAVVTGGAPEVVEEEYVPLEDEEDEGYEPPSAPDPEPEPEDPIGAMGVVALTVSVPELEEEVPIEEVEVQIFDDEGVVVETFTAEADPEIEDMYGYEWEPPEPGTFSVMVTATDDEQTVEVDSRPLVLTSGTGVIGDTPRLSGLDLWLTADKENVVVNDDDEIVKWLNDAPDSRIPFLKQQSRSRRPKWIDGVSGVLNEKPLVRFDGDDDFLKSSGTSGSRNSVLFMVVKTGATVSTGDVLFSSRWGSDRDGYFYLREDSGWLSVDRRNLTSMYDVIELDSGEFKIITVSVVGEEVFFYENGAVLSEGLPDKDGGGQSIDGDELKRYSHYVLGNCRLTSPTSSYNMPADVAEVLIYIGDDKFTAAQMANPSAYPDIVGKPVLTRIQRTSVELYLCEKYGIGFQGNASVPFIAPMLPSTATVGETVELAAQVSDLDTIYSGPEFYIDVSSIGNGTQVSGTDIYEKDWVPGKPGIFVVTVKATDDGTPRLESVSSEREVHVYAPGDSEKSDQDDIDDWWELAHFDDIEQGSNDPDGDGFTTEQEFENGTNPNVNNTQDPGAAVLTAIDPLIGSTVALPTAGDALVLSAIVKNASQLQLLDKFGNDITDKCNRFASGLETEIALQRKCVVLDGSDDTVAFDEAVQRPYNNDFTVCAWVRLSGDVGDEDIIVSGSAGEDSLQIACDEDGKCIVFTGLDQEAGEILTADLPVPAGLWVHCAITRTAGLWKIYYDGVEVGSESAGNPGKFAFDLETIGGGPSGKLEGMIDDFRIYNKDLSAAEIQSVMEDSYAPATGETLGHWRLDSEDNGTTPDSSGNANDATLTGGAALAVSDEYASGMTFRYTLVADDEEFVIFFMVDQSLPTVSPSVKGGRYMEDIEVGLTASEEAAIYFSTDGELPDVNETGDKYCDAGDTGTPITLDHSAGDTVVLHFFAVDRSGNQGPLGKEVYCFADVPQIVEGVTAEFQSTPDRVVCSWSAWTPSPLGYHVYKVGNVHDLRMLAESRSAAHRPPKSFRITPDSPLVTAQTYTDDGPTLGKTWYGVTVVDANGTESPISELATVELTTQTAAPDLEAKLARSVQWLSATQAEEGYWGQAYAIRHGTTSQVLRALRLFPSWVGDHRLSVRSGLSYIRGQFPDNCRDLAATAQVLQLYGDDPSLSFNEDTRGMHIRLALRAYEELGRIQGWGSQSRYYFDAPSTALAILARNGSSLGVPSSGTDDSEANLGETKSSNRLMSGIAGHDGYGWVPKGPDSIYVSCLAYVALGRNTTTHSSVHAWILGSDPQVRDGEQETNGSFNDSLRDTSAVLLWLPIDGSDKTEAVEYLEGEQSPNGSWQGDPYLTGLCVEALKASQE